MTTVFGVHEVLPSEKAAKATPHIVPVSWRAPIEQEYICVF